MERFVESFGIPRMPWVVRVYLVLLIIFILLILYSMFRIPIDLPENSNHPAVQLFSFALDNLKLILGAVLGSLSLAGEKMWGAASKESPSE